VRENCTPGSVRGAPGNGRSYRDEIMRTYIHIVLCVAVTMLSGCTGHDIIARIKHVEADTPYTYPHTVKDTRIWRLFLDWSHPSRVSFRADQWQELAVNTRFTATVKNTSAERIYLRDLATSELNWTPLAPGASREFVTTNYTGRWFGPQMRGSTTPPQRDYSVDVSIRFGQEIDWKPGLLLGLYWTDSM
jgi:hypothetical protein